MKKLALLTMALLLIGAAAFAQGVTIRFEGLTGEVETYIDGVKIEGTSFVATPGLIHFEHRQPGYESVAYQYQVTADTVLYPPALTPLVASEGGTGATGGSGTGAPKEIAPPLTPQAGSVPAAAAPTTYTVAFENKAEGVQVLVDGTDVAGTSLVATPGSHHFMQKAADHDPVAWMYDVQANTTFYLLPVDALPAAGAGEKGIEPPLAPYVAPAPVVEEPIVLPEIDPMTLPIEFDQLSASYREDYIVVRGDTLQDISAKFYADSHYWPMIWYNNSIIIDNPDIIEVGQVLRIYDLPEGVLQLWDTGKVLITETYMLAYSRYAELGDDWIGQRRWTLLRAEEYAPRLYMTYTEILPEDQEWHSAR